ncbi:uncharacterized protein [Diabrotica undecimpunctata]|uniref:uncharacterized protein n=1 Tax=Diabrotica undecimpunctata TaxID=50387 RepID=UPI003B637D10
MSSNPLNIKLEDILTEKPNLRDFLETIYNFLLERTDFTLQEIRRESGYISEALLTTNYPLSRANADTARHFTERLNVVAAEALRASMAATPIVFYGPAMEANMAVTARGIADNGDPEASQDILSVPEDHRPAKQEIIQIDSDSESESEEKQENAIATVEFNSDSDGSIEMTYMARIV